MKSVFYTAVLTMVMMSSIPHQAQAFEQADVGKLLRTAACEGCDLKGADLQKMDLQGVNLRGADLRDANLSCSQLENANMTGAILDRANMANTFLHNAILDSKDLQYAEQEGAYFDADTGLDCHPQAKYSQGIIDMLQPFQKMGQVIVAEEEVCVDCNE